MNIVLAIRKLEFYSKRDDYKAPDRVVRLTAGSGLSRSEAVEGTGQLVQEPDAGREWVEFRQTGNRTFYKFPLKPIIRHSFDANSFGGFETLGVLLKQI